MSRVYDFGDRLKRILRLKDMRQKALARLMYLSEAAVSQYIHGERLPNIPMLISMAKALDVTTDQLLGLAPIDTAATPPIDTAATPPAADKYVGEWIPVSERLPETYEAYLVQDVNGIVFVDYWRGYWLAKTTMVAWRELPIPYKGGDSE